MRNWEAAIWWIWRHTWHSIKAQRSRHSFACCHTCEIPTSYQHPRSTHHNTVPATYQMTLTQPNTPSLYCFRSTLRFFGYINLNLGQIQSPTWREIACQLHMSDNHFVAFNGISAEGSKTLGTTACLVLLCAMCVYTSTLQILQC